MYARVALPRSAPEALVYAVPDELARLLQVGVRVRVPLRRRAATGIVVGLDKTTELDPASVRALTEVLDDAPLLPGHLLELAAFVADYYRCPLGDTLAAMLPAGLLRADAEEVEVTTAGIGLDPSTLPAVQSAVLTVLQRGTRRRLPGLLAEAGAASRTPVEALAEAGLVRLRRHRRDRPPQAEVAAVALADAPIEELVERAGRARGQRAVVEWLAEQGRPALVAEVCAGAGCSPSTVRAAAERGLVTRFTQRPAARARWTMGGGDHVTLTDEQREAVARVETALADGTFTPLLLEGVTGSGKTEVYLRCIEKVLAAGRGAIVLVPEIGLTPAAVGAVERRFGSRVAVLHSAQAEGERWLQWQAVRAGEARVVVGPRSALFAPVVPLGLVVVDEEHDAAYKQQEAPRYHARDVALVLGQRLDIPVLLCSATPSVESSALVRRAKADTLRLTRRVAGAALPAVEVVDLRGEPGEPGEQGRTLFSQRLRTCLSETLERGEQAILLMQRRGWAPVLLCRDCGHRLDCTECSVAMVVHRRSGDLRCHYCGAHAATPRTCPACGGTLLDAVGAGTEKVADHLERLFPGVANAILDRDTVRRRGGLEATLGEFAAGRVRVLVGTQMVAKGHHFPRVTLTGVISADALLGLPDFRAAERTFQLLTQVAGRAGRGGSPGRVVIQTYYPDHPAVRHACGHDVAAFLEEELIYRRAFHWPPAARLALVRFEAASATAARRAAETAAGLVNPARDGVRLRGPAPAPLERIRGQWRWQLILAAPGRPPLRRVLDRIEASPPPAGVRRVVDVDPVSTL